MVDVATFSIVRQGDPKAAIPARQNAVTMEPALPRSSATAKAAAPTLSPIERAFNPRWINFFGEHAAIPEAKGRSTAKLAVDPAQDSELVFAKLHDNLKAAWSARDAAKLETVASAHLKGQATSGTPLIDPFTRKLYDFFKARGCNGTGAEIIALIGDMTNQQINDYLTSSAQLVSKLKAQAFAAMVNGTLSQQGIDLLLAIKSIAAFQLIAAAVLNYGKEPSKIPVKLICATLDADISFPEWTFDVDPCRWAKRDNATTNPRGDTGVVQSWPAGATAIDAAAYASATAVSPLRRRIEQATRPAEIATRDEAQAHLRTQNPPPNPNLSYNCECYPEAKPLCLPPDPCCAKINYYVTDTLVLRDTVKRYLASDLAYIENIAAGETRIREHSFAKTIEDYTEEEATTTKSEERDHQVTERFSVQNEIEKNLKIDADAHAEYNSGAYKAAINGSVSKETAQREAREQFREAVDKAVTKLQVETRKLTSRRVTTREEEKNTHSFANLGSTHTVAKYFYVSKEVEGQIFSYGLQTTVELLLPSPAALYEHMEKTLFEREWMKQTPCVPDVISWRDVTKENYLSFQTKYCLPKALPEPPADLPPKSEVFEFSGSEGTDDEKNYTIRTISVPPGYYGSQLEILGDQLGVAQDRDGPLDLKAEHEIEVYLSNSSAVVRYDKNGNVKADNSQYLVGIDMHSDSNLWIRSKNIESFTGKVRVFWSPLPVDITKWQKDVAASINETNAKHSIAEAKREFEKKYKENQRGRHPFTNKEIILSELKRAAIYMMCEDFERGDVIAPKTPPCGYPEINRKTASQECADWYFWETAFDWRLMSFVFFDYFWNKKCDWPEKFAPGHDDFMFNAFLRSGMARIMVPVRPGMEADVIFYLETGQKWGLGGQPPMNPQDPRWISVVQELKHARDCYQNDREGMLRANIDLVNSIPGSPKLTNVVRLEGSDRYWDPLAGTLGALNQAAIDNDTGREIFIDGVRYRIVSIALSSDPLAPAYDPAATSQTMWWDITLDRPLEAKVTIDNSGNIFPDFAYAIGAAYVGAPFRWQEPTNLVWLGDADDGRLPEYPISS
ncbi:MAG: hypothetical protein J0M19_06090 [Sphingomonadales bacterium]|nr:hypothetical protein [Sphingomonadales bacterium]